MCVAICCTFCHTQPPPGLSPEGRSPIFKIGKIVKDQPQVEKGDGWWEENRLRPGPICPNLHVKATESGRSAKPFLITHPFPILRLAC